MGSMQPSPDPSKAVATAPSLLAGSLTRNPRGVRGRPLCIGETVRPCVESGPKLEVDKVDNSNNPLKHPLNEDCSNPDRLACRGSQPPLSVLCGPLGGDVHGRRERSARPDFPSTRRSMRAVRPQGRQSRVLARHHGLRADQ
jgi:hypothetical protein